MKNNDLIHNPIPDPGWQLLGELELPAGVVPTQAIHTWLMNVLDSLTLSEDFLDRVLQSAQESASRELLQNGTIPFDHIHLSVFTPSERFSSQKTWGFFHTERTEEQAGNEMTHIHRINFYLYGEGE